MESTTKYEERILRKIKALPKVSEKNNVLKILLILSDEQNASPPPQAD